MGALRWNDVVNEHEGWRLFSCIWLHAGIVHLAANMLSLVFIGIRLEQQFGFGMFFFFPGYNSMNYTQFYTFRHGHSFGSVHFVLCSSNFTFQWLWPHICENIGSEDRNHLLMFWIRRECTIFSIH